LPLPFPSSSFIFLHCPESQQCSFGPCWLLSWPIPTQPFRLGWCLDHNRWSSCDCQLRHDHHAVIHGLQEAVLR
jgi:hypothetical protein